jgi:hypothetical protein
MSDRKSLSLITVFSAFSFSDSLHKKLFCCKSLVVRPDVLERGRLARLTHQRGVEQGGCSRGPL